MIQIMVLHRTGKTDAEVGKALNLLSRDCRYIVGHHAMFKRRDLASVRDRA